MTYNIPKGGIYRVDMIDAVERPLKHNGHISPVV